MIRVKNQKAAALLLKRSLKANRVRNAVAVFVIALTTFLFTALFTVASAMLYTSQQQTFRQVGGSFHGGFKDLTLAEKEELETDGRSTESGAAPFCGWNSDWPGVWLWRRGFCWLRSSCIRSITERRIRHLTLGFSLARRPFLWLQS